MTTNGLSNKYFVRKNETDNWADITALFSGVKILSISGFDELGDSLNVFTQQWIGSQSEDYYLSGETIIRNNVDLSVTFIVGERYGASDTQTVHDAFVSYMCKQGDFYLKSAYVNKYAHVVCLKSYKPTTQRLHRGRNSYIMGTITLHTLTSPSNA